MNLAKKALEIAIAQIGRGEQGRNNAGQWVREYRRDDKEEAWCAAFVSWCYELAWAQLNGFEKWSAMPRAEQKACPLKRSSGAKRLCKPLKLVGVPEQGDIALWNRGVANSNLGHVGMVSKFRPETGEFFTVEGNRGSFPSRVREFSHVMGEGGLIGIYRVPV